VNPEQFPVSAGDAGPNILLAILRDRYHASQRASVGTVNFPGSSMVVDRQHVIHAHPQPFCMILPERGNVFPRDSDRIHDIPTQHIIRTQYIEASLVADPNRSILRREHRVDQVRGEPLASGKRNYAVVAETVQAFRSGHPEIAFAILEKIVYVAARQAVLAAEMIEPPGVQSIDSGVGRPNPQRAFAVDEKYHGVRMGSTRQHSLFYEVIGNSVQAEAFRRKCHPDGPVAGNGYTVDPLESAGLLEFLPKVRLKGTVTPPDELIRASNPQIALYVLGERFRIRKPRSVVAPYASGVLSRNLA
jgi:hypothetical protein